MNKIVKLDKHLMNMIAAGEVVERPAGIVKELVENAIDANATIIEVNFKAGGTEYISVLDNGDGMSREDALLAFERHATSKIKEEVDLWSIHTLGFRGEAIPSIASVAKVTLRTNNNIESHQVVVKFGDVLVNEPYALNKGTEVIVENLFHNTPARLKSFNSINYERAIIISTLEKFAFAYPKISFILNDDEREILHTSGNDNLIEIMYHVYGKEVARNSFSFSETSSDFDISGVLVRPDETRANRNHIQIFINDRMIRSYKIANDVINGYKHLMFNDRFPIAIIKLSMDHQLVDVNVHPSKWEVRIQKERVLSDFIINSIKSALSENMQVKSVKKVSVEEVKYDQITLDVPSSTIASSPINPIQPKSSPTVNEDKSDYIKQVVDELVSLDERVSVSKQAVSVSNDEVIEVVETKEVEVEEAKNVEVNVENIVTGNSEFLELRPIGQLHGKYILAESPEALYIIDQHAAEERVNFEKIRSQIVNNVIESSPLLIPVMIEVKSSELHSVDKLISSMESIGLIIEEFSSTSIVVREVPLWLLNGNIEEFVLNVLGYINEHKDVSLETLRYDVIATKACKASIKFNHTLSEIEIKQVIINLSKCDHPYHCPHGRPTLIKMTDKQLIKEFMR